MTYETRTAICTDESRSEVAVLCRVAGERLREARETLTQEHPELRFVAWVYDLDNPRHRNDLRLAFLSPSVLSVTKWVDTPQGFMPKRITREMILH